MENNEYYSIILQYIKDLKLLRKEGVQLGAAVIGESLFKEDLYFLAAINRCLDLIDGFIELIDNRNLTCAGALLRLQMDNCMRTYAVFIADNKDEVVNCIISGERIDNLTDNTGQKLKDWYLKKKLNNLDNRFQQVYDQASGYIHLSTKAFYQTIVSAEGNTIETQIGHGLPDKYNVTLIEGIQAFIHFTKLFYKIIEAVADSKRRFDKKLN